RRASGTSVAALDLSITGCSRNHSHRRKEEGLMRTHRHKVLPRVEALEDRWVPACTVTVSPTGGMTITGDAGDNQIAVFDNGSAGNGNVSVVCDGVTHTFPTQ